MLKSREKHFQILSQRSDEAHKPDRNSWMTLTLINPKEVVQTGYEHTISKYAILNQKNCDTLLMGEMGWFLSQ